ncbi:molybdenum cofactor biosynthesis protein MoaE [Synechococcus sp. RSCCF101]|uniref:molybdopterin synthase catalytic subunit n=1 Tax=Synechococcus sp. RSCCF101 TaxID=2511069 RepID=UPI00124447F0|nr:molybdenum cofactor biosynthesis protein MoaE [Synechococcus sp. RSCCF101]QEY32612.1 molybdenum cofactor biosynthesis protein MoaE [Synechococcus sp. RSCCF101]
MHIHTGVQAAPISVAALLEGWTAPPAAAEAQFIGRMRPTAGDGQALEAMDLEHYPGMTEAQLQRLAAELAGSHRVASVLLQHRVGRVRPGEVLVLVAVRADRRGPAQRCCQALLERVKSEAALWKREWSGGRGRWLDRNTPLT